MRFPVVTKRDLSVSTVECGCDECHVKTAETRVLSFFCGTEKCRSTDKRLAPALSVILFVGARIGYHFDFEQKKNKDKF